MIQVNAGISTPIFINTTETNVSVVLIRVSDKKYWNGTVWSPDISAYSYTPYTQDIIRVDIPPLNPGYYIVQCKVGDTSIFFDQIYAGGYFFNTSVDVCNVYGVIKDMSGEPVHGARISFEPTNKTQFINGTLITIESKIYYSDDNGNFNADLIRGAEVIVTIDAIGLRRKITVPDQASVSILDLL